MDARSSQTRAAGACSQPAWLSTAKTESLEHLKPSGTIWGHLGLSEAIWYHLGPWAWEHQKNLGNSKKNKNTKKNKVWQSMGSWAMGLAGPE